MGKLDCIFLHVPKLTNYYRPMDHFIWINFLPMGLLGLADLLQRHHISTQVVHLGVEWIEDRHFSIVDYIQEKSPRIIAFDLHWHHQSYDVMEMVKKVKAASPSAYVLFGGYTASFFHEEIMRNFDGVDGVIRGEAEVPILELAETLLKGREDLFSVPNLTWRRKGRILINPGEICGRTIGGKRWSGRRGDAMTSFSLLLFFPQEGGSLDRPGAELFPDPIHGLYGPLRFFEAGIE